MFYSVSYLLLLYIKNTYDLNIVFNSKKTWLIIYFCYRDSVRGGLKSLPPPLEFWIFRNLTLEKGDFVILVILRWPHWNENCNGVSVLRTLQNSHYPVHTVSKSTCSFLVKIEQPNSFLYKIKWGTLFIEIFSCIHWFFQIQCFLPLETVIYQMFHSNL